MFTAAQRDQVRRSVIELARQDPRITAGALTGSTAYGGGDAWSDVDVAFGVAEGSTLEAVLEDWTRAIAAQFGLLDYFDLRAGPSIYRVFLLPTGLEVDVGLSPEQQFGARGPQFSVLFGAPRQLEPPAAPDARYLAGLCWHHVIHARACIERGKQWQAEYWISALRDHTLELVCLRHGLETAYSRGSDRLPAGVRERFVATLVRSLDVPELRRALGAATARVIEELGALDAQLCARLRPLLVEAGGLEA